jgi:hypothetical protein
VTVLTPVPMANPRPAPWWAQYAKALLALAGTTPPAVVFAWLDAAGICTVPPWLAALTTVVSGVAAVLSGPKNAPRA